MKSIRKSALVLGLLVALLCGCGGGGGGDDAPGQDSTDTFALWSAYANFVQRSATDTASIGGNHGAVPVTGSASVTTGKLTSTSFEGNTAYGQTTVVAGTLTANGQTLPLASTSDDLYDASYRRLGAASSGAYDVVTAFTPFPATAKVGDTGRLYTANRYTDTSKGTLLGTTVVDWSLLADTPSTALLVVVRNDRDAAEQLIYNYRTTLRLAAGGQLTRLSETSANLTNGLTLTFTYR